MVLAVDLVLLAAVLWATRGPLAEPSDRRGMLEAGAFLALLLIVSPETRPPHYLSLALPLAALTYAMVDARRGAEEAGPASSRDARRWKILVALAILASVLVNTVPPTFVGRRTAVWCNTFCALAIGAGLLAIACLRARRLPGASGAPVRDTIA